MRLTHGIQLKAEVSLANATRFLEGRVASRSYLPRRRTLPNRQGTTETSSRQTGSTLAGPALIPALVPGHGVACHLSAAPRVRSVYAIVAIQTTGKTSKQRRDPNRVVVVSAANALRSRQTAHSPSGLAASSLQWSPCTSAPYSCAAAAASALFDQIEFPVFRRAFSVEVARTKMKHTRYHFLMRQHEI